MGYQRKPVAKTYSVELVADQVHADILGVEPGETIDGFAIGINKGDVSFMMQSAGLKAARSDGVKVDIHPLRLNTLRDAGLIGDYEGGLFVCVRNSQVARDHRYVVAKTRSDGPSVIGRYDAPTGKWVTP